MVMIVVLMGVTGSGKTTVGRLLAADLGWTFVEGDDFHPPANVEKMHRGEPLDDADRVPWLRALRSAHRRAGAGRTVGGGGLLGAEAGLPRVLAGDRPEVAFVYLKAPRGSIDERLRHRVGHFMPPALLASQLATLEAPEGGLIVDATPAPAAVVAAIRRGLGR